VIQISPFIPLTNPPKFFRLMTVFLSGRPHPPHHALFRLFFTIFVESIDAMTPPFYLIWRPFSPSVLFPLFFSHPEHKTPGLTSVVDLALVKFPIPLLISNPWCFIPLVSIRSLEDLSVYLKPGVDFSDVLSYDPFYFE